MTEDKKAKKPGRRSKNTPSADVPNPIEAVRQSGSAKVHGNPPGDAANPSKEPPPEPPKEVHSSAFQKVSKRAIYFLTHPHKALGVLQQAADKAKSGAGKSHARQLVSDLSALVGLLRASVTGKYPHVPWGTLVKAMAGVLYFLLIVDVVPDFIPWIGWMDDATVLTWIVASMGNDLNRFRDWQRGQKEAAATEGRAQQNK